ncbi:MAG TPA: zf-TFIIB domain-containing protein [Haliangiales bacterium]|nr:zf-TFIIB domain-containing protein [Haliangiales bacterium]
MKKPSETEEEYFAREEAARLQRSAVEKNRAIEAEERERLKKLHYMRCPKCGMELREIAFKGVKIDRCFNCHGTWLDHGELERVAGKEPGFLDRIAAVFRHD